MDQESVALSVWHTVGSPCLGMSGCLSDVFTVFGRARSQRSHGELEAWLELVLLSELPELVVPVLSPPPFRDKKV